MPYTFRTIGGQTKPDLHVGLRAVFRPSWREIQRPSSLDIDHPSSEHHHAAGPSTARSSIQLCLHGKGTGSDYLEPTHKKNFSPHWIRWTPHTSWNATADSSSAAAMALATPAPTQLMGPPPIPVRPGQHVRWNYTAMTGTGPAPVTQATNPTKWSLWTNFRSSLLDPTLRRS